MTTHFQTPHMLYPQGITPHFNMTPVNSVAPATGYPSGEANETKESKESTVFVGNICESAPDDLIRTMLNTCGSISQWKRAQGSSGKLQAFGFCTYKDPESAIRAIKMLHDLQVGSKLLTVRVDENTQEYLDTYKKDKSGDSSTEETDLDDEDRHVKNALVAILKSSEATLARRIQASGDDDKGRGSGKKSAASGSRGDGETDEDGGGGSSVSQNKPYHYSVRNPKMDLNDMDVDDSRKHLISQEISKFRESYKDDEVIDKDEIDRVIKRRAKVKKERRRSHRSSNENSEGEENESADEVVEKRSSRKTTAERRDRKTSRSRDRDSRRKRSRDRSPRKVASPSIRRKRLPSNSPSPLKERLRRKALEDRRERSRERERDRDSPASRRRDWDRSGRKGGASSPLMMRNRDGGRISFSKERRWSPNANNDENDEDKREQEKLEKQLREKEAAYQERLKTWETREKKKIREADKDRERERERIKEQIKEAKRLKEFLEEYDDQRDDPRFYEHAALHRRLRDREKEKEIDERDRMKERDELDEILQRLKEEKHPDPENEVAKIVKEFEENMNKPLKERERELKDRKKKRGGESSSSTSLVAPVVNSPSSSKRRHASNGEDGESSAVKKEPDNASAGNESNGNDNSGTGADDDEEEEKHKIEAMMKNNGGFISWKTTDESMESISSPAGQQQPIFEKKMTIEFGKKTTNTFTPINNVDEKQALTNGGHDSLFGMSNQLVSNYDSPNANNDSTPASPVATAAASLKSPSHHQNINNIKLSSSHSQSPQLTPSHPPPPPPQSTSTTTSRSNNSTSSSHKKKLQQSAASVFTEDDDEAHDAPKKRKLIPVGADLPPPPPPKPQLTAEEKQQKVKELISKIPTEKKELFNYNVEWEKVDDTLMEKRIKPWVNKKIKEYIGEEEPTLVDFMCSKVKSKCSPQLLLDDVQMVLDDEAEVFIVKLWRLLIYETEAKKQGLSDVK